jgi:hypothetical protein
MEANGMKYTQQTTTDSLVRSRDFVEANRDRLGPIADLEGKQQIDTAVAAITEAMTNQGTHDRLIAGHSSRQRALVQELDRKHLRPIRLFARAKLEGVPDFAALTALTKTASVNVVTRAALSMAAAATKYIDKLVAGGFPADEPKQILDLVAQIQAARAERQNLRVDRVHSTNRIDDMLAVGREGVRALNAVIVKQFADDAAFLAAWRSASRVEKSPTSAPVPDDSPAPVAPHAPVTPTPVTAQPTPQKVA